MSQVIHSVKDSDYNTTLFLFRNSAGLFAVEWGETCFDPFPYRWKPAGEIIRWAIGERYQNNPWADIASMANFILGYFPESEVVLAALEYA